MAVVVDPEAGDRGLGLGHDVDYIHGQAVAVVADGFHLGAEQAFHVAAPLYGHQAFRLGPAVAQHVGAVRQMHGNAPAPGDVAHDLLPRQGAAAGGHAHHGRIDAVHDDAGIAGPVGLGLDADLLGLFFFIFLPQLGDYGLHPHVVGADGSVQVVDGGAAEAVGDLHHHVFLDDLGGFQVETAAFPVHRVPAQLLVFLPHLLAEPLADAVFGLLGLDYLQPVPAGAVALGGHDLDDIAVLQLCFQGHQAVVDPGAHAGMAHLGVDAVGEIQRYGAGGQLDDVALGRKDVDVLVEQVLAHGLHELAGIPHLLLPFQHIAEPFHLFVEVRVRGTAFFVAPVGGDAVFGDAVHIPGADLHLEGDAVVRDQGGVDGLVHVLLGHGDVVLEAAGNRLPHGVDDAQTLIALPHRVHDDADGVEIEDLGQLFFLPLHFPQDAVIILGAAGDLAFDAGVGHRLADAFDVLVDEAGAFLLLLGQTGLELGHPFRLQHRDGQVFQLALDAEDAQPVGQRRVDGQGLLGDLLLPQHRMVGGDGAHIVQPVGQLDQDDADIAGHGHQHTAQVFRLGFMAVAELQLAQLGHALHQHQRILAEAFSDDLLIHGGVLHHVVEQAGGDGLVVDLQGGQYLRHRQRMHDIRLAAVPQLIAVGGPGQLISAPQQLLVGCGVVRARLLDDVVDGNCHNDRVLRHWPYGIDKAGGKDKSKENRAGRPYPL